MQLLSLRGELVLSGEYLNAEVEEGVLVELGHKVKKMLLVLTMLLILPNCDTM